MTASTRGVLLPTLLALITAVGPISTDMYLPAFPAMRQALGGDQSSAPLTLAAWFAGIAIGQLIQGPLSDRFGRRLPLLAGTALYVLASAMSALAGSMHALIALRALAAFGGAAGLVIPRAIIRDVSTDGDDAARLVSRLQLIMSVIPMLAPTVGGLIVEIAGWRTIFWVAAIYGFVCLVMTYACLPETAPRGARVTVRTIARRYAHVLSDRTFVANVLTGSFATFSLFAFLGGAPSVFLTDLHLQPAWFGAMFIANGAGYAAGTWMNVLAIRRFGRSLVLSISAYGLLAASVCMLALAATGTGVWGIEGPTIAIMVCLGCLLPDAAIGAIGPHGGEAGTTSALYGTIIFSVGACGTFAMSLIGPGAKPMAVLMIGGAMLAVAANGMRSRDAWESGVAAESD
jgi:DHA1 family bicyclomycin/chloramphenicol resistance-like MFS transporter